jgi:RNA recognition motif-containing protein
MTDTIFVRSIPYNTTEPELKKFFTIFGEIEYAKVKIKLSKLVINKITNENNGTGFVKFKAKEVAQ